MNQLNLFINSITHLALNKVSGISTTKQKTIIVAQVVFCGLAACLSYLLYKKWGSNAQKLEVAHKTEAVPVVDSTPEMNANSGSPKTTPKTSPKPLEKVATQDENIDAGKASQPESIQLATESADELQMNKDLTNFKQLFQSETEKTKHLEIECVELKKENEEFQETINLLSEQLKNFMLGHDMLEEHDEVLLEEQQILKKEMEDAALKSSESINALSKQVTDLTKKNESLEELNQMSKKIILEMSKKHKQELAKAKANITE